MRSWGGGGAHSRGKGDKQAAARFHSRMHDLNALGPSKTAHLLEGKARGFAAD